MTRKTVTAKGYLEILIWVENMRHHEIREYYSKGKCHLPLTTKELRLGVELVGYDGILRIPDKLNFDYYELLTWSSYMDSRMYRASRKGRKILRELGYMLQPHTKYYHQIQSTEKVREFYNAQVASPFYHYDFMFKSGRGKVEKVTLTCLDEDTEDTKFFDFLNPIGWNKPLADYLEKYQGRLYTDKFVMEKRTTTELKSQGNPE